MQVRLGTTHDLCFARLSPSRRLVYHPTIPMDLAISKREDSDAASGDQTAVTRPFLKWAGGKRQLLPQLRRFIPRDFRAYCEPFVGSGALFFDLWGAGRLDGKGAQLFDTNADLIGCYRALVQDVEGIIRNLKRLTAGHEAAPSDHYYRVRDQSFNPARRERSADGERGEYPAKLAAMFIYLNRTGFNGLYRLNLQGAFNVPAGRYANPRICDAPNLRAVARALASPGVELRHDSYESVLLAAHANDFIYFDPPYAPLSTTARFTSYTANGFSDDDQRRLQEVVLELVSRGCSVVLSNSTAPIIADLYETNPEVRRAGLRAHRVPAKRAINSDPTARGDVMEFIITNVQPIN
jgi:DNA adenine methylase